MRTEHEFGASHMQSENAFSKILVPVDGSAQSVLAQELAALIAKKLKAKVTAIHVVAHPLMHPEMQKLFADYVPVGPGFASLPPTERVPKAHASSMRDAISSEINDWYRQKGQQYIAEATSLFKEEGVLVDQKLVEHADPAETIIHEAQKGNYSLIVIGHNGQEEPESRLGSIAEKVSRHAQTPVLIARQKNEISKILVPLDGSENAEKALPYAALLAQAAKAKITVLHVEEPHLAKVKPEVAREIGTRILSRAADKIKETKPEQKLESGHPAKMIIKTAKEGDYDLIIMGNKGHSTIERFLLGSVSDHVIHYTDRSVLLAK
jgi:nucleotide-binding universal stress UspA family protein